MASKFPFRFLRDRFVDFHRVIVKEFLAAFDIAVHVKRESDDEHDTRRRLLSVSRYDEANQTLIVRREPDGGYTVEGSATQVRRYSPGSSPDARWTSSPTSQPKVMA